MHETFSSSHSKSINVFGLINDPFLRSVGIISLLLKRPLHPLRNLSELLVEWFRFNCSIFIFINWLLLYSREERRFDPGAIIMN